MIRNVKILETGCYLPSNIVTAEQVDEKLNVEKG